METLNLENLIAGIVTKEVEAAVADIPQEVFSLINFEVAKVEADLEAETTKIVTVGKDLAQSSVRRLVLSLLTDATEDALEAAMSKVDDLFDSVLKEGADERAAANVHMSFS